ncbi:MAG: DUF3592 domain-containing protein [Sphingobacteriales bacterium]|nr:MAG: DUF3592 domain-containing protein [Sphingobacteriales bacterium]
MQSLSMFYSISLGAGGLLLVISLFLLNRSISFIRNSEKAVATVIEMETIHDSDGNTYKPIFQYKTSTGQEFIYRKSASSSPASWQTGEQTTIAYNPNDPGEARILTYFGSFGWSIVLMAIAMPFVVIGGGYFLTRTFLNAQAL